MIQVSGEDSPAPSETKTFAKSPNPNQVITSTYVLMQTSAPEG